MHYLGIIEEIKSYSPTISVNIIDCNVMELGRQLRLIEESSLRILHFDVMDGCFVPMISFGPCFIKAIKTKLLKEVQLFVHDPGDKIWDFINSGADILTLHIESDYNLLDTLLKLKNIPSKNDPHRPVLRGLALNPEIPVEDVAPFIHEVEMITINAYNYKIKNGRFDEKIFVKVEKLKRMIDYTKRPILLCINGNMNIENIDEYLSLDADIYTCGEYIFKNNKIIENIDKILLRFNS